MGSFCGSSPQTVVTSASNPNVTAQQNQIYGLVNQYATDFGQNPSQLVAPWNQLQTSAAQGVSDNVNSNQPWDYLGEGAIGQGTSTASYAPSLYAQGAQTVSGVNPISSTPWNPTQYESPYTQDVINATTANINQQNQIAQNGALGNAIQSGNAFGGDRAGVMMGNLANQQALAENQTIASLQQADFNQASQQANAQQQYNLNLGLGNNSQLMQQAGVYGQLGSGLTNAGLGLGNLGYQTGNLGNLGQQSTLGALQGLYNMGTGLQGTQQQQLSAPLTFGQWYGNASPGTSSVPTSTTYPGSNPLSTITGLGLTGIGAASMLSNLLPAAAAVVSTGGRVNKDSGGGVGEEDDLVGRYHRMTQAMHRMHRDMGGGAQQPGQQPQQATSMGQINPLAAGTMAMIGNVPQSRQMPTTEAAQLQRNFRLMRNVSNPQEPGTAQAAIQQLETQQASTGGAIHKYDGGGMGMDPAASSIGDLSPDLKMKAFERAMKLAHRGLDFLSPAQPTASSPTLDLPPTGTQRPPGPLLGSPSSASGSPTQAPSASANSLSQLGNPSGMMGLLKLVDSTKKKPPTQAPTVPSTPVPGTADSASPVYGPGSDTGGGDMGAADLGSGADFARGGVPHFDGGGGADDSEYQGDAGGQGDTQALLAQAAAHQPDQAPTTGSGSATPSWMPKMPEIPDYSPQITELMRSMPKGQGAFGSFLNSPGGLAFALGSGILAHSNDRTPQGTAVSAAAGIGRGLSEGVGYMSQQQKQDLDQRRALLEALQHQQNYALQAAKTPAEIAHFLYPMSPEAKEFQLHIEKQKMEYAKQLEMTQMMNQLEFLARWKSTQEKGQSAGTESAPNPPNGRYRWDMGNGLVPSVPPEGQQ